MGDYTRFEFNAKLRGNTPQEIVDVLQYMMDGGASSVHPETQTDHARSILEIGDNGYRLKVLSSFKNYDNEVRLFCDWIAPYLDEDDGTEVGTSEFEYDDSATKLFKDRGVVVFLETENSGEPYDGPGLLHD